MSQATRDSRPPARPLPAPRERRRDCAPARLAGRLVTPGVPALTAAALGCWQLSTRSFTQDEAATLSAARRPLGALVAMLGHIDAVHGVYYLLIHAVVELAGASETAVRLPSVLATAVAAGVLAVLAARLAGRGAGLAGRGAGLAGRGAGLAAGTLYAASPPATEFAQLARPYALAAALVLIACHRLAVLAGAGRRRDAVLYAAALAAAGWVNLLTLLVAPANVAAVAWAPAWRARLPAVAAAAAAAGLAVSPLIWLGLVQRGQIGWERPPTAADLLALAGVLVAGGLLALAALRAKPALPPMLAAPWLLLPPLALAALSLIIPMWEPRYLLFCLPALVLLMVGALAGLPGRLAGAAAGLALAAALAGQVAVRPPVSADDLRAVSRLLARQARHGDAVVFPDVGRRLIKDAYPAGFARLRDVGLDTSPAHRDALYGLNVSQAVLSRRLAGVSRLWVIRYPTARPAASYGAAPGHFCAARTWQIPGSTVTLYRRGIC